MVSRLILCFCDFIQIYIYLYFHSPIFLLGVNALRIDSIAIPLFDNLDNSATISHIAVCLAAFNHIGTIKTKLSNHFECDKVINSLGVFGQLYSPKITFQERILLYIAARLHLLCGYEPKSIATKISNYIHTELCFLGKIPKYTTLDSFLKGVKYIFQKPFLGRSVLTICTQLAYNNALDINSNILENAIAGADVFATMACARSCEYLLKNNTLDHGRSSSQFLCLEKLSDPYGRSLNLQSHKDILDRIKF